MIRRRPSAYRRTSTDILVESVGIDPIATHADIANLARTALLAPRSNIKPFAVEIRTIDADHEITAVTVIVARVLEFNRAPAGYIINRLAIMVVAIHNRGLGRTGK